MGFELEKFLIQNFLVIAFIIAITIALAFPLPGMYLGSIRYEEKSVIQFINTFIVFFISGITLQVEEFKNIRDYLPAVLYGIFSINVLTTFIAPIFLHCTFLSSNYRLGFTIFACVPTTLGVGVALTHLAKGDVLLSLMLTVLTNIIGTLTTPFILQIYLRTFASKETNVQIDSIGLFIDLSLDVLIPTILGMFIHLYSPNIRQFVHNHKVVIGMFSTCNLAMIIWMALSKSRDLLVQQSLEDFLLILVVAIIMHICYLLINGLVASRYCLNFELSQCISIIIMTSQKSNPVALAVINGMGLTNGGLVILPGILGQLSQIFIGSFISQYFQNWIEQAKKLPHYNQQTTSNQYYQLDESYSTDVDGILDEHQFLVDNRVN